MECRHLMNPMHSELIHDHHWMDCHGNRCLPTCSLHAVCSAALARDSVRASES